MATVGHHASDWQRRELSFDFALKRNLYFMSSLQQFEKSDELSFRQERPDESPPQKRRICCVTFKQRIVAKMQRIGSRCQAVRELL
jgi:hypothetical protein